MFHWDYLLITAHTCALSINNYGCPVFITIRLQLTTLHAWPLFEYKSKRDFSSKKKRKENRKKRPRQFKPIPLQPIHHNSALAKLHLLLLLFLFWSITSIKNINHSSRVKHGMLCVLDKLHLSSIFHSHLSSIFHANLSTMLNMLL